MNKSNSFGLYVLVFSLMISGCKSNDQTDSTSATVSPSATSTSPAPAFEAFPIDQGQLEREVRYVVQLQGQTAGRAQVSIYRHETPQGIRRVIRNLQEMNLARTGANSPMTVEDVSLEDEKGRLLRMTHKSHQHSSERLVEAGKVGNQMITLSQGKTLAVPFEPDALEPTQPYRHLFKKKPAEIGQTIHYRTYSPQTGGYTGNQIFVRERDAKANTYVLEQTIDAFKDTSTSIELGKDGLPKTIRISSHGMRVNFVQEAVSGNP